LFACRLEDGVDGEHVAAGGFEGDRDGAFTADGGGEGFAFDGVLITGIEGLKAYAGAEVEIEQTVVLPQDVEPEPLGYAGRAATARQHRASRLRPRNK